MLLGLGFAQLQESFVGGVENDALLATVGNKLFLRAQVTTLDLVGQIGVEVLLCRIDNARLRARLDNSRVGMKLGPVPGTAAGLAARSCGRLLEGFVGSSQCRRVVVLCEAGVLGKAQTLESRKVLRGEAKVSKPAIIIAKERRSEKTG